MNPLTVTRRSLLASALAPLVAPAQSRPNILWITCEDTSPDLGCYGDRYARTPHLDRFAGEGMRFTHAFSTYGVCAPSRSSIITGMYPATIGTHHMRCQGVPPPEVRCFSEYLRAAGYFCTNNVKTDYNFAAPLTAWDENSRTAHYRNRAPGQPFFSVFNIETTHESRIRSGGDVLPAAERHDPRRAPLPSYYPDTPVVRRDWARYCDLVTAMDREVGARLAELERDGLAGSTVVFFYGDHGRGLPRAKRWVYDSGIRVPLLVRWPGAVKPGSVNTELVSLLDLGPTLLSIAGLDAPRHLQGRAFLGSRRAQPREYIYAARDRMDETYDIIRAVRDRRWKYIRNYQPEKPYAQPIEYMDQMPSMQDWRRLAAEGRLAGPQRNFFAPHKPPEELYDTVADPDEVVNLALQPRHHGTLARLRAEHERFMRDTGDLGLVPEGELLERQRPGGVWQRAAAPRISNAGGRVHIECDTPGASIAYSTGGAWKLYAGPFRHSGPVRARACRLGFEDSVEVSAG